MVSLVVLFWMFVFLFALIGAIRGWAKEILVTFSIILAIFLITVLESYVDGVKSSIVVTGGRPQFWFRAAIVGVLVFFGFQTPRLRFISESRFVRERLQDILLGLILGAFNGFLIVGSLWAYLDQAGYPFDVVQAPVDGMPFFEYTSRLLEILPPEWMVTPWVYLAVGLAFVFVIVVFI